MRSLLKNMGDAISMLGYDSFTLERVILELRFQTGYLYWDNCGKIWLDISEKWPNLSMRQVTVEQAAFQLSDSDIQLSFSHNRVGAHIDYPAKLDTFKQFTDDSFQVILEYLKIKTLSRVGNRYQYILKVGDVDEATNMLMEQGLFYISPERKNLKGKISEPSVKFIIEQDDISTTVRIGYIKRSLEFSAPKPVVLDKSAFIEQGISVDFDFFTTKPVDRGILSIAEFINTHQRNSRKLIENLFR